MRLLLNCRTSLMMAVLATMGCAPAFENRMVTTGRGVAVAIAGGVRVTAQPSSWRSAAVATQLVPLQLTLENESGRPLRVFYHDFTLVTRDGQRLPALPAFDLAHKEARVPGRYAYPWSRFFLAAHLSPFYRGFWTGARMSAHDSRVYDMRYRTLRAELEPTVDMQRRALPEGVLEPSGFITGTLYFSVPTTATTLTITLVDATSRESFATVELPVLAMG